MGKAEGLLHLFILWHRNLIQSYQSLKHVKDKFVLVNTKYYESQFEKLKVRRNYIMIIKLFKNNSNKSNNEYYNLESIIEKFIP